MNQFAPILPELILTVGGIVLMMVAAWGGRRSGGFTSWAVGRGLGCRDVRACSALPPTRAACSAA